MHTEPPPLSDADKLRRLPWIIAASVIGAFFSALSLFSPAFLLFLSELGLDKARIGLVLSLVPFCGILAPLIAPAVARFGVKRTALTFWTLRKLTAGLLAFTPAVLLRWGPEAAFRWIAALVLLFGIWRAVAETGVYPWQQEAIPNTVRGKLYASSNIAATLAGIAATTLAGYLVGASSRLDRFALIFGLGTLAGLLMVFCQSFVPGGAPRRTGLSFAEHRRGMAEALRDKNFTRFLAALPLAALGGSSLLAFTPLYAKEQLGLAASHVVLLSVGTYAGTLLSAYLWGWSADRYGSKPVMLSGLCLLLALPLLWFLIPRHSPLSAPLAVLTTTVGGIATPAWTVGWVRYLYVSAIPPDKRTAYTAVYYVWSEFMGGCGPLLAGSLLTLFRGSVVRWGALTLDAYTPLFALSALLLCGGIVAIARLRNDGSVSWGEFLRLLARAEPLRPAAARLRARLAATRRSGIEG